MLRAMVDTMVFDAVADDGPLRAAVGDAVRHGRLRLVTTPVQEQQVAAVPDPVRRKALRRLPREVVPAAGQGEVFDVVRDGQRKHLADAAIAEAALERCDVLVTEDRRMAERAAAAGVVVWGVAALRGWLADGG